jgi:PAS domain S-box-containing protein
MSDPQNTPAAADPLVELRAANEHLAVFRRFVEASALGCGMTDRSGRITYANLALSRLLGEDRPEDMIGKCADVYYSEEDRARNAKELTPALLATGSWTVELNVRTKQGTSFPALHTAFVVDDASGRPLHTAVVITDITAQKRAAASLAESETKYRQLIETTDTGYVILDEQGRVVDANEEYVRLTGRFEFAEVVGRSVLEWTPPHDIERSRKELQRCLRVGGVRHVELDHILPEGQIVPLEINASCLETHQGRRVLCLCRDISERREIQESLRRERQTLWHMLQASDHERQLIAYEIHDGLTQQLAAAIMQFQAHEHLREQPDKAAKAFEGGLEMLHLAYSEARRLISGVRPPVLDEAGLETAIAHLVHDGRVLNGPKIEYQSDVQFKRLPAILENALYRIAQEALTNAAKHSQSPRIRVKLLQRGEVVYLEVQDWGVGFDPAVIPEGHFGLEGIRERVRLLGGEFQLDSTSCEGTVVRVTIPLPSPARNERPPSHY